MRDQNINTFQKGMMTDLGETLPQEGNYVYGENIRIISTGSDSGESGVVVNVRGNTQAFNNLTRPGFQLEEISPEEPGLLPTFDLVSIDTPLKVIGSTFIREKLILFAISDCTDGDDCTGFMSGIYMIDINNTSFPSLSEDSLNIIFESADLNFSEESTIEAIGRYENELMQRIYWTDNINPVRVINIVSSSPYNLKDLELIPSANLSQLKIKSVTSRGQLPAGIYQYAYRLTTKEGLETRFTAFTPPIHIVDTNSFYWKYNEDPENQQETNGNPPGSLTNGAAEIIVNDVDSSYDYVEFLAIYRDSIEGVSPGNTYVFDRKEILGSSVSTTHTTNTPLYTISFLESVSFSSTIYTAKTIAHKDNKLFLGNIIEPNIDLRFNSRAYRWKRNDNTNYPYKETDNVSTYVNFPDSLEVTSADLDAINPFNSIDGNDRNSIKRYKYQKDGVTIGGEGPYVSYKFIKKILSGDSLAGTTTTAPPFISSVDSSSSSCDGDLEDTVRDFKSGDINQFKGYQRDEVYRFGVVLHDRKGNPGYVNWIGDIRFPSVDDVDVSRIQELSLCTSGYVSEINNSQFVSPLNFSLSQTGVSQSGANYWIDCDDLAHQDLTVEPSNNGGDKLSDVNKAWGQRSGTAVDSEYIDDLTNDGSHYLYALGIEFTVSVPDNLKEFVSGYSIVRVKREEADKTVLGTGLINYFHWWVDAWASTGHKKYAFGLNRNLYYSYQQQEIGEYTYFGFTNFHSMLSFDSAEFPFTQNYPNNSDCTYFEYYGSLGDGRERDAYRGTFDGTSNVNYRKYLSHIVEKVKPRSHHGWAANNTPTGYTDWEGPQGYYDINKRFDIDHMFKLNQGEILDYGPYSESDNYGYGIPWQLHNFALETEMRHDNFKTRWGGIGVGEETLFIQLPRGYNGTETPNPWYLGALSAAQQEASGDPNSENPPNMSLHISNWMPKYNTIQSVNHEAAEYDGQLNKNVAKYEKLLGVIRRDSFHTIYGGVTEIDRQNNTYIATSGFNKFDGEDKTVAKVFSGDTYVTFYDIEKTRMYSEGIDGASPGAHAHYQLDGGQDASATEVRGYSYAFPIETTINTSLRTGYHFANKSNFTLNENDTMLNQFEYNKTYSAENDLQKYYPKNNLRYEPEVFDYRIAYSDSKEDSELVDSWRNFKPLNFKDLEGTQGSIMKLAAVGEGMVFLQERGTGVLKISPLSTTLDQSGTSIVLGKGDTIADFQYLSRTTGLQDIRSSVTTGKSIYWLDSVEKSLYTIGGKGLVNLSDSFKISSLLESIIDEIGGKSSFGYDNINGEVLFNLSENTTLVFSEKANAFTSIYTMDTPLFVESPLGLYSFKDSHGATALFYHSNNKGNYDWYGETFNSSIEFIVNKNPIIPKVFDNLEWYAIGGLPEEDLFETAEFNNSYETASVDFETTFPYKKVKEKMAKTPIPRNQNNGRFRDTYLKVKLITKNTKKVVLHYVKTLFRISRR